MADNAVVIEIGLLGGGVFVCESTVKSIANAIYYRSLHHIGGGIGIYHDTAVHCTENTFHIRLPVGGDHVHHMRRLGIMTKIGCYAPVIFFIASRPLR